MQPHQGSKKLKEMIEETKIPPRLVPGKSYISREGNDFPNKTIGKHLPGFEVARFFRRGVIVRRALLKQWPFANIGMVDASPNMLGS